jgi:hypothetical protein
LATGCTARAIFSTFVALPRSGEFQVPSANITILFMVFILLVRVAAGSTVSNFLVVYPDALKTEPHQDLPNSRSWCGLVLLDDFAGEFDFHPLQGRDQEP